MKVKFVREQERCESMTFQHGLALKVDSAAVACPAAKGAGSSKRKAVAPALLPVPVKQLSSPILPRRSVAKSRHLTP